MDRGSRALASRYPRLHRTGQPGGSPAEVRGIAEKAKLLASFPEIGYLYEGRRDRPIRILLYGHYRIAYLARQGGDVDILGVFHGALDIARHLRREDEGPGRP